MWKKGILVVTRDVPQQAPTPRTGAIINYIRSWKTMHCNSSPDSENYEAPVGFTRRMLRDNINQSIMIQAHESTICKILSKEFPEIKFPSVQKFTKCSECVNLRNERDSTLNPDAKACATIKLKSHYDIQKSERLAYAYHTYLALTQPDTYVSIAIDGMDQFKTRLPKFVNLWKDFDRKLQLVTHITGVKVHGYETDIYVDFNQVNSLLFLYFLYFLFLSLFFSFSLFLFSFLFSLFPFSPFFFFFFFFCVKSHG